MLENSNSSKVLHQFHELKQTKTKFRFNPHVSRGHKKKNKVILAQRRLCVCGNFKKAFLVAFFPFRFEKEKQVRGL